MPFMGRYERGTARCWGYGLTLVSSTPASNCVKGSQQLVRASPGLTSGPPALSADQWSSETRTICPAPGANPKPKFEI